MLIKKKYTTLEVLRWTRYELVAFTVLATIPTALFALGGWHWLQLPWTPIALVGTAVAFLIGFQNNAAYGRIWEARKIWGGITNVSRSFGIMVQDLVRPDAGAGASPSESELQEERRKLIYRHIAWITALRHSMRTKRPWEVSSEQRSNREWQEVTCTPERHVSMEDDLRKLLSPSELEIALSRTNPALAIQTMQSQHLRELKERGLLWEFSHLEMEKVLVECLGLQGKSERIKNFPYPRQYATLSFDFVRIFLVLLPLGVIPEFAGIADSMRENFPRVGPLLVWLAIPFSVIVSWVFQTMQRIGTVGENPFEGGPNDVPISTMSRGIEIDLREQLGESSDQIPDPVPALYNIQM